MTGRKRSLKRARKSAEKTLGRTRGRAFQPGPDARRGRGPKKGAPNAGRPRQEHIAWCQGLISDPKVEAAALGVLRNRKHPLFANLWGKIADRAYGRPTGSEITFPVNPEQLTDDQLTRIAQGEDPLVVLATARQAAPDGPAA